MMKLINKMAAYISLVISIFSMVVSTILFTQTTDYKLEKLSYNVYDYNKVTYDNLNASMLSVSFNEHSKNYSGYYFLQSKFYNNNFVKDSRFVSNECYETVDINTNTTYNAHFISQNVFSKQKKDEHNYILEYGKYALFNTFQFSYAKSNDFCFISEDMAKKILVARGHKITEENKIEYFDSLCFDGNKDGIIFEVPVSNEKKIKLAVLGVIRSDFGSYKSTQKSVGSNDFILTWLPFKYPSLFDFSYEIELKVNPYGNKDTFKFCMSRCTDITKYDIKIKQYNGTAYDINESLTNEYYSVINSLSNSSAYYYTALAIVFVGFILFFIFNLISFKTTNKSISIVLICYFVLFILYGIAAQFIFVYPLTTLILLVYFINYLFLGRKQLYEFFSKIMAKIKTKFDR